MSVQTISPIQAKSMQQAGALILDVREPWEVQLASIADALNIPMNHIPQALTALPQDQDILCICHHGMRSMQIANYLSSQGFERVFNITGGSDAWSRTVDTTVARY